MWTLTGVYWIIFLLFLHKTQPLIGTWLPFNCIITKWQSMSPGIVLGICGRLYPGSTWRHIYAQIKVPTGKTPSEFSERVPVQTKLRGRMWQWWTRAHGENESWGLEDGTLVNHAQTKQIRGVFVNRDCSLPSFLLLWWLLPWVSVMSLNEKRKRTISPFSFLMGTISSRHQKATPGAKPEMFI